MTSGRAASQARAARIGRRPPRRRGSRARQVGRHGPAGRVVVLDEQDVGAGRRSSRRRSSSGGSGAAGQVDVDRQPAELGATRRRRSRRARRPSPARSRARRPSRAGRPRRAAASAGTCRRSGPRSASATPGPPSSIVTTMPARSPARRRGWPPACPAGVWSATLSRMFDDDRVEQHGVDPDERQIRRHVDRDGPLRRGPAQARHGPLDELGRSKTSRSGRSAPGLDAAQVEDRADEPVEALGLGVDRLGGARGPRRSTSRASGSARFPAVARMLASGVRRSCETESSRALLRASLRRATSALVASWRRRSRRRPSAIWSAASESSRVASASGDPLPRRLDRPERPEVASRRSRSGPG